MLALALASAAMAEQAPSWQTLQPEGEPFTIDMPEDRSQALIFDAARVADGPIARITLPERISSGTHSTWAPGSALPGWDAA